MKKTPSPSLLSYTLLLGICFSLLLLSCHNEPDQKQIVTSVTKTTTITPPSDNNTPPSDNTTTATWADSFQLGSSTDDFAQALAIDSEGNLYVTGKTTGNLDGNTNAGSDNTTDLFVTKLSSIGVKQWTQQLGTSNYDQALGVATDSSNNVYVVGSTQGNLDGNTNQGSNDNNSDFFIVKYSSAGIKQWTQQWGGTNSEFASSITIDSQDNIYLAGSTLGDLGSDTNAGESDLLVVKYATDGTKQWSTLFGSTNFETAYGIQVDSSNNVYVAGSTTGNLNGGINAGGSDNSSDFFIMKLSSTGTQQWNQQFGTALHDVALGLTLDSADNIYVTGYTSGGLDGNTNVASTDNITDNDNSSDAFIVKYSSTGVKQWTQQLGSTSFDIAYAIATDSQNNVYLTGSTRGGMSGNTNANSDNSSDLFLAKYSSAGTQQWLRQLGSAGEDRAVSIAINSSDQIHITGFTSGGLDGGINAGGCDLFLIRYDSDGARQSENTTISATSDNCSNVGIAVQSSTVSDTSHNVGQACLSCHSVGSAAYPPFTVAGSVYHSDRVIPNRSGRVIMAFGAICRFNSEDCSSFSGAVVFSVDSSGNFYSRATAIDFSKITLKAIIPGQSASYSWFHTGHETWGAGCNGCHNTNGGGSELNIR